MTETITYTECTVRGMGDRPVRLYVDSFDDGLVAVKPDPRPYDRPLCFKRELVFERDGGLLREIEKALDAGNFEAAKDLWAQARLWSPEG